MGSLKELKRVTEYTDKTRVKNLGVELSELIDTGKAVVTVVCHNLKLVNSLNRLTGIL